ncbi:hypothetical protein ACQ5SO_07420 [Rhodovulum sp. DZ06]|uniref:hypothetical protein n=1 Tax=Rhodovulum sp. DZ06 TaxID=3425126 RepID=UPI003D338BE1
MFIARTRPASAPRSAPGLRVLLGAAALGALGACSVGDLWEETPEVEVQVLAPSQPQQRETVGQVEVSERRAVERVDRLEIGRVHEGLMLSAFGTAPRQDWFSARLEPRREGLPGPDGFIEFDFVAAPPELNGFSAAETPGSATQRAMRADAAIEEANLAGAAGLRVHAAGNAAAIRLAPPAAAEE